MFPKKIRALLGLLALAGLVFLASGRPKSPESPAPTGSSPESLSFGWIDDPEAVRECLAEMECLRFRDTPAFAAADAADEDVFLWEACREVTGDVLPARDQKSVGCCVGFATASAIEHLLCVQIVNGESAGYRDLVQEVIYGGSRVEIGGGRVRGDGSIGAWAAKWVKTYGVVPRGTHDKHDLREYDEVRCRAYGRTGVPDDLEPLAKAHPVRGVANVRSWDECRAAIRNGYPVVVCSSQGFRFPRDANGFCPPHGLWYHAMAVIGVRGGSRPGGFVLNSWGAKIHTGPRFPPDAPEAGFWIEAATLDRMLAQGDSWAFSLAVGFPAREVATGHRFGRAAGARPNPACADTPRGHTRRVAAMR